MTTEIVLTMTPEHAYAVAAALDLYAGVGCGCVEDVASTMTRLGMEGSIQVEEALLAVKPQALGRRGHGGLAINNLRVPEACRQAYDVQCVIRKALAVYQQLPTGHRWHDGLLLMDRGVGQDSDKIKASLQQTPL